MTSVRMVRSALLGGLAAAVSHAPNAEAALYKCTGADGKVAYQDAPCPTNATEQALQAKKVPPPAAATKNPPGGTHTASAPKADAGAAAKAAKSLDVRITPEHSKAKDSAPAVQPAPDPAKSATAPGK